jgi:cytochrome c peroxidase
LDAEFTLEVKNKKWIKFLLLKRKRTYSIFIALLACCFLSLKKAQNEVVYEDFFVPKGWPKPVYNFKDTKLTQEGFELGRKLFYDPILSKDSTISCSSCHSQYTGFAHTDHAVSHGIEGRIGTRNALPLMNLAWVEKFHWDGGVLGLNSQPINPITNSLEMDNTMANALLSLNHSKKYQGLFYKVFGVSLITTNNLLKSIAQFTVSLQTYNSKYDKVMRHEKGAFFTEQEQNGHQLFKRNCESQMKDLQIMVCR